MSVSEPQLKSSEPSKRLPLGEIPPPIIYEPLQLPHHNTILFLHGRGFNAEKFSAAFLSEEAQEHGAFRTAFPHTRFVFPVAPLTRATKYRRTIMHQWYDGSGDWEPEARGDMRKTVEYIQGLLRAEVRLAGGDGSKIVLAGISQGCAMALTSLLLWNGAPLGAVVGMCGFMPITAPLLDILESDGASSKESDEDDVFFESETAEADLNAAMGLSGEEALAQEVINALWEETELPGAAPRSSLSFRSTPLFFGHGVKDEEVDYSHACEAVRLLEKLGIAVEFHAYAELGHWYSAEMLGDVITFLAKHIKSSVNS
jgi:predicted esterase